MRTIKTFVMSVFFCMCMGIAAFADIAPIDRPAPSGSGPLIYVFAVAAIIIAVALIVRIIVKRIRK